MRRKRTAPPPRPHPFRRLFLCMGLLLAPLLAGYAAIVQYAVTPRLEDLAEYQCRAVVAQAMNRAVNAEMEQNPQLYRDLYATVEQNGTAVGITADAAALNQARLNLVEAVQNELQTLPESELRIPIGSLVGVTALGGWGPGWELRLLPQAYVESEIREECCGVSINRTQYTATLELSVTINMVLDGKAATAQVTQQVPLTSFLLEGDTPQFYSADDGALG